MKVQGGMADRDIYFVRHGQTEWNAERRMQGQGDSPLTPTGRTQAVMAGQFFAKMNIDKWYASPLGRVRETVDAMASVRPVDPTFDERLKEWDCGEWSGYLYSDLESKWPKEYREWEDDRYYARPPGGENYPDMIARSGTFLDDLLTTDHKTVVIVSHGMIARTMVAQLLDLKVEATLRLRQRNNVIIQLMQRDGKWSAQHFDGHQGPRPGPPKGR